MKYMSVGDNVAKKETPKDVEIIIQYEEDNTDEKESKSLQMLIQKLFDSYLKKVMQNYNKGK